TGRMFVRVKEAWRTLGSAIIGLGKFDACGLRIPVPVLGVRIGLDAIASHVEPDRRVECRVLADQYVGQFIVKGRTVFRSAEVALSQPPVADGFGDARKQGR